MHFNPFIECFWNICKDIFDFVLGYIGLEAYAVMWFLGGRCCCSAIGLCWWFFCVCFVVMAGLRVL